MELNYTPSLKGLLRRRASLLHMCKLGVVFQSLSVGADFSWEIRRTLRAYLSFPVKSAPLKSFATCAPRWWIMVLAEPIESMCSC